MPTDVIINAGGLKIKAQFFDTGCARAVVNALPVNTRPNVWGDEFYFTIPVKMPLDETATTRVKVGDIGYWPPGNALAIFFGPTPLSTGPDPVPASEVNIVGRVTGQAKAFRKVRHAFQIVIEREKGEKIKE